MWKKPRVYAGAQAHYVEPPVWRMTSKGKELVYF
jgi:hypothetical protein